MQVKSGAAAFLSALPICAQCLSAQEVDRSSHEILLVDVAPGVQLEVLDWGGQGAPLVFLAGLTRNAHEFDHFAPRFSEAHRVYGVTRRGHGASTWPASGYDLDTRVRDLEVALDSLGLEEVIFAGHSQAGEEMTRFASAYPERVRGLVYIDAGHDHTLVDRLRLGELCPLGGEVRQAIEQRYENLEDFRRTQLRDGAPYVAEMAVEAIMADSSRPDYTAIRAPALGVYLVPRQVDDIFLGAATPPIECVTAFQRYIYDGIAQFAAEMQQGRIVAIQDSQHHIHLASPDELEAVMKAWLATLGELD